MEIEIVNQPLPLIDILFINIQPPKLLSGINYGLAYIMAAIEHLANITLYDSACDSDEKITSLKKIDIIGFSVNKHNYDLSVSKIHQIKKLFPDASIVFGGIHVSLNPELVMKNELIDYVLIGESERSFCQFLGGFQEKDFGAVDGLYYRDANKKVVSNCYATVDDLDQVAFPALKYFNLNKHVGHNILTNNSLSVISSRGCVYTCDYCSMAGLFKQGVRPFRYRSYQNIIDELLHISNQYLGVREIAFEDQIFGYPRSHAIDLLNAIITSGLNQRFHFICQTRMEIVDSELIELFKKANFSKITFGIESGSQLVRKRLGRSASDQQIFGVMDNLNLYDIRAGLYIMYGLPGERILDFIRTLLFIRKLNRCDIYIFRYYTFPGVSSSVDEGHIRGIKTGLFHLTITLIRIYNLLKNVVLIISSPNGISIFLRILKGYLKLKIHGNYIMKFNKAVRLHGEGVERKIKFILC